MGYEKAQNVRPFTESEYRAATDHVDVLYRGRKRVHLHKCQAVKHTQSNVQKSPPETVPFGFWDVCPFCRLWWREEHGGEP